MRNEMANPVGKTETAIPELLNLCNQIHARIQELEGCSRTINSAIWRLLSPRPTDAGEAKDKAAPEPNSLEANLRSALRRLDCLNGEFGEHCKNLDSAV